MPRDCAYQAADEMKPKRVYKRKEAKGVSYKKPVRCSRCHKPFSSVAAATEHVRAKHKYGEAVKQSRRAKEPDEESMADRAVNAQIDKAMGIYNFDQEWLI